MKHLLITLSFLVFLINNSVCQDITTVTASSDSVAQNLDLEAVASVFGEASDLEDFEKRLNDPDTQISNLDLNNDGEVDYLRVIEDSKDKTHVVIIQSVIGEDQYQDVATIDVDKDDSDNTTIQVVGDVNMYGPNYIIEPVYVSPPVIVHWFWGPLYRPWASPYYWGHYPHFYHPRPPFPPHRYHNNVQVNINVHNTYHRTNIRRSRNSVNIQNKHSRHDHSKQHQPRNVSNKSNRTSNGNTHNPRTTNQNTNRKPTSTGKKVDKDWNSKSGNRTRQSTTANSNRSANRSSSNVTRMSSKKNTQHLGGNSTRAPQQLQKRSTRTTTSTRTSSRTSSRRGRR